MHNYSVEDKNLYCDEELITAEEAAKRLNQFEEVRHKVEIWAEAYPLEVFPEPDMEAIREIRKEDDDGGNITLLCAQGMRHVITQVQSYFGGLQDE